MYKGDRVVNGKRGRGGGAEGWEKVDYKGRQFPTRGCGRNLSSVHHWPQYSLHAPLENGNVIKRL